MRHLLLTTTDRTALQDFPPRIIVLQERFHLCHFPHAVLHRLPGDLSVGYLVIWTFIDRLFGPNLFLVSFLVRLKTLNSGLII